MAVSSEAIANAAKIAAIAQRRRSQGKPSVTGVAGLFAAFRSTNMLGKLSASRGVRLDEPAI